MACFNPVNSQRRRNNGCFAEIGCSPNRPFSCSTKAAMCRTHTHKYVKRLYEPDELYDLVADPLEEKNIARQPEAAKILSTLKERMLTWYMETCDIVPRKIDKR